MANFIIAVGFLIATCASLYANYFLYEKLEIEKRRVKRLNRQNIELYLDIQQLKGKNNG